MKCIRNIKTNMITRVRDAEARRLVYMEKSIHRFIPKRLWKNQQYRTPVEWTQGAIITAPSGEITVVPIPKGGLDQFLKGCSVDG